MNLSTAATLPLAHTSSNKRRTRASFSCADTGAASSPLSTRSSLSGAMHHAHDATRRVPAHRLEAYSPECAEEEFSEVELPIYGVLRSSPVEQGVKSLLQGSRLLSAPDGTPCGLGASASLLGGALLLRGRLPRNWLPRNWLPRFRGSLGLNRHHLSIIG